jgi:hypothetical protein
VEARVWVRADRTVVRRVVVREEADRGGGGVGSDDAIYL